MGKISLAVIAVCAASLAATPVFAEETRAPGNHVLTPLDAWTERGREPAITRTLRGNAALPAPDAEPVYDPDWRRQQVPAPQAVPSDRFSIPQQGYYPREGEILRAPGYEYDSGGAGTYPPSYPMEGASLRRGR